MSFLSALCDLYILYTFILCFLYSINVAYVNLEQNCTQKVNTCQKECLLRHNCFGFNVMYTFYIQNIDCNLLNQHNNCIQKLYKVYTCCI